MIVLMAIVTAMLCAGCGAAALILWRAPEPDTSLAEVVTPVKIRKPNRFVARFQAMPKASRIGLVVALGLAVLVTAATGWFATLFIFPAAVFAAPALGKSKENERVIARLGAMEEWTSNLSTVLTAGLSLENAIDATPAPKGLYTEVAVLKTRLRAGRMNTEEALRRFGVDLDHITGHDIVSKLMLAANKRGDGLGRILADLAQDTADNVATYQELESDRAKPRQNARLIVFISLGMIAVMTIAGFMDPYGTPIGQIALIVLAAAYLGALRWMYRRMIIPAEPGFIELREQQGALV